MPELFSQLLYTVSRSFYLISKQFYIDLRLLDIFLSQFQYVFVSNFFAFFLRSKTANQKFAPAKPEFSGIKSKPRIWLLGLQSSYKYIVFDITVSLLNCITMLGIFLDNILLGNFILLQSGLLIRDLIIRGKPVYFKCH